MHPIVQVEADEIGHDYDEDEEDLRMREKMKDHPDYVDQLQNGIWWDVDTPSMHRWHDYED